MRIIPLIVLLACVAWPAHARAQDEGDARAAPSRGLLKRGLLAKGKPTTTTTTPAPQEETEYEDEAEYVDEAQEPSTEAPSSSTEGKKLVAGGVRPFRSNADLLEALKRRRAQAAEAKLQAHTHVAAAAPAQEAPVESTPAKSSYTVPVKKKLDLNINKSQSLKALVNSRVILPRFNQRRSVVNNKETTSAARGDEAKTISSKEISTKKRPTAKKRTRTYQNVRENTNKVIKGSTIASFQRPGREKGKKRVNTPAKESKTEEASGPVKPGRGRFGRPSSSRAVQEESEEQNESAPAPIRTGRTFRRGN